jgi:hypothetical protein
MADGGQQVELNAFDNDHLIEWLERKLHQHGVEKLIPNDDLLADAYRRALLIHSIKETITQVREAAEQATEPLSVPETLFHQVRERLKGNPSMAWDEAVSEIAKADKSGRGQDAKDTTKGGEKV